MRRGLNELSGRTSRIRRRRMDPQVATNKNAIAAEVLPANSPGPPRPYPGDLPEPKPAEPEIQPERRAGAHRAWGFLGGFLKTHRDFRICRQKPLRHFIPHRRALLRRLPQNTALRFHSPLSPLRPARGYADLCSPPATRRTQVSQCSHSSTSRALLHGLRLGKNRSMQAEGRRHP